VNGSPHFVLFGTPVRVEPTFFLVAVYLSLSQREVGLMVAWVAVMFVGILVHELGHAMAYRAYGRGSAIVLWGFGGLTFSKTGLRPGQHVLVSLAGPITGLLLLGLPAWWLDRTDAVEGATADAILGMVVFVNIFWSVINLLPVLPLDGGNIARDLLTVVTKRPAERPARYLSIATAVAAGLYGGVVLESPFALILGGLLAFTNFSALRKSDTAPFIRVQAAPSRRDQKALEERRASEGVSPAPRPDAPDAPLPLLEVANQAFERGDTAMTMQTVERLLAQKPYPDVARSAVELRAWALLADHRADEAVQSLADLPRGRKANRYLRAALHAASGGASEPEVDDLVQAYLFAGEGRDRAHATEFVAWWGLADRVAAGLVAAGHDGIAAARQIEAALRGAGHVNDADRVNARLLGQA
jgi:Zn-dependent protease